MSNIFDKMTASSEEASSQKASHTDAVMDNSTTSKTDFADADRASDKITSDKIKSAVQELMKFGLLEADRKPNLYQQSLTAQRDINIILEPLDLELKIDDVRGLAFLIVANTDSNETTDTNTEERSDDDWSHPLVRRQRLTLEQSLLIAILRQFYVTHEQEAGIGASHALVDFDDLLTQLQIYLGDIGSDSRERKRLDGLLDNLSNHGLVSVDNSRGQVTVRPIITHLANPASLQQLLNHYRTLSPSSQNISPESRSDREDLI